MDDYAVVNIDAGNTESYKIYLKEGALSGGKDMQELGSAMKVLTQVDLDLAYSSEKLVNLHKLLMHMLGWENDFEAMAMKNETFSEDSFEKALIFDLLSGILDSEVRELDSFMSTLQAEIVNGRQKIISCRHLGEMFNVMEEKLHDSEESWKQFEAKLLEMKLQSSNLQRAFLPLGNKNWNSYKGMDLSENGEVLNKNAKSKMQTAEQQRHVLRMLERSLARELDLEKRFLDLREHEEELKLKLHYTQEIAFHMEKAAEVVWGRFLEAENTSEVLMGISKELLGRLQLVQLNLISSIQRESEAKNELQDCTEQLKAKETALQKLESSGTKPAFQLAEATNSQGQLGKDKDKCIEDNSEVFTLRKKVKLLEEQLKESEVRLEIANASNAASQEKVTMMENIIESLKESIYEVESRAESAESKVTLLTETNLELTEELRFLKGSDDKMEKVSLLEKQLRDLEIQLQHARTSSEASQEQQNMLYSAIWDMETLIEDLKSKVAKAEIKNERAEEQFLLLSETNFELNKELSFLKAKMECLEASLLQAYNEKVASTKEISTRSKLIMDTVMQLAIEREHIQKQIYTLRKEKKKMAEILRTTKKDASLVMHDNGVGDDKELFPEKDVNNPTSTKTYKEAVMESTKSLKVDEPSNYTHVSETEVESSISATQASKLEALRRVETRPLNLMYVFIAILVSLISVLAMHLFIKKAGFTIHDG